MQTTATNGSLAPAPAGLAVYVHWPFCVAKCPYCDFNSHVRDRVDGDAFGRALLAELDHFAAETAGRTVTSLFFGGGTPSLMAPAAVAAVIDRVAARWPVAADLEVTLEANPGSVEAGRLAGYRAAGVNRVSLGVQSLDDAALRFLGRKHDAGEARAAVALAGRLFDRFSFDLIYTLPGQSLQDWARALDQALAMAGDHLSVYQLTIEPGTAFARAVEQGRLAIPDEATSEALFDLTQQRLEAAGLPAYEISNHARPGSACRHNLTYWRYGFYVGVGPGAHGRLPVCSEDRPDRAGRIATEAIRAPEAWAAAVARDGHGTRLRTLVDADAGAEEAVMMGLRLTEGIDKARFSAATGRDLDRVVAPERRASLVAAGDLCDGPAVLRATAQGRKRLNAVIAYLIG
ncbi:MAG: radical SAM family heme chaperone HemW [Alphaproteobacteria bacterium]